MKRLILLLMLCFGVLPLAAQETTTLNSLDSAYMVTVPSDWHVTSQNGGQLVITSPTGETPYLSLRIFNPLLYANDEPLHSANDALREARGFFRFIMSDTIETADIGSRNIAFAAVEEPPFEHVYFIAFQLSAPEYYGVAYVSYISDAPDTVFTQILEILATVELRETPDDDFSLLASNFTRTAYIPNYLAEEDFRRLSLLRANDFIPDEGRTVTTYDEINPINDFVPIARFSTLEHVVYSGIINFAPVTSNGNERCSFVTNVQTNIEGQLERGIEFGIDSGGNAFLLRHISATTSSPLFREYLGIVLENSELHLQVVVTDGNLWLYINGQRVYAGQNLGGGDFGISGVRIVRESEETTCQLTDIWLYDTDNVSRFGDFISCAVTGNNVNTRQAPNTEAPIIGTLTSNVIRATEQAIAEDGTRWWHLVNGAWVSEVAALEANINECFALPIVGEALPAPNETCELRPVRNDNGFYPNRRTGPGEDFPIVNPMTRRNIGIAYAFDNEGNRWWQMGDTYWVREDLIALSGDCEGLPEAAR